MPKLLAYYAEVEDDYEDAPLTLVNRTHPVIVKRQAPNPHSQERFNPEDSTKQGFFPLRLPMDVFFVIIDLLNLYSVLNLSATCKALRKSVHLQKAMFQKAYSMGSIPTSTYRDFQKGDEMLYRRLLATLEESLGSLIHRFVAHEFMSISQLQDVARCCPNLHEVDFSGIMEPIDYTRYKHYLCGCQHGRNGQPKADIPLHDRVAFTDIYRTNQFSERTETELKPYLIQQSKCYACRDRFQWPLVLKGCPELFAKLTSIRLLYEGHTAKQVHGSKPGREHLPYLLKLMPRLQTLAFECWRDTEEKFPDRIMSWYLCSPPECHRFLLAICENASDELRVLELNGIIELVLNIGKFCEMLEKLPKLRWLKVALHHDLKRRAAQTWLNRGVRADTGGSDFYPSAHALVKETRMDFLIEYIVGLRHAIARGWTIKATKMSDGYNIAKPWRYFSLLEPDAIQHLRWLLQTDLDWNPTWKWKSYMYRDRLRQWWRPSRHDPNVLTDSFQLRKLFSEIRAAGKIVRLRLATPGDEDSFFAWQQSSSLPMAGQGNYDVLPWRLDVIGDMIDEIELLWSDNSTFGTPRYYKRKFTPDQATPEYATQLVIKYLTQTRPHLERRLRFEAERMSHFFAHLKQWCPHLRTLKLFIPNPFYSPSDHDFISRVLPGSTEAWTVSHVNAKPDYTGYTKRLVVEEETGMWGQESGSESEEETEEQLNRRRKISHDQIYDMLRKQEGERCPMLERVFEKRVDEQGMALKGLPSVHEEWNVTRRPVGVGVFDTTDFEKWRRRKFQYLWPA